MEVSPGGPTVVTGSRRRHLKVFPFFLGAFRILQLNEFEDLEFWDLTCYLLVIK